MTKPVLLIRPDRNDSDAGTLAEAGFETYVEPWLEVRVNDATAATTAAAKLLQATQRQSAGHNPLIVFTSPRAWAAWAQLVGENNLIAAITATETNIYCIGAVTQQSLPPEIAERAISLTTYPPNAEEFAQFIIEHNRTNSGIPVALIPGSAIMRTALAEKLQAAGWQVLSAPVYHTEPVKTRPKSADLLQQGAFTAVVARSPSAVRAINHFVGNHMPAATMLVTIGTTTWQAAQELGFAPMGVKDLAEAVDMLRLLHA